MPSRRITLVINGKRHEFDATWWAGAVIRAAECLAELPQDATLRHLDHADLADAMLVAALQERP